MEVKILTEGDLTTALLERLVTCHPRMCGQEVAVSGRQIRSSISSAGRTILIRRGLPVAAVVNTDTSADPVRLQRWYLESSLMEVAPSTEWRVILLEPNVEGLLWRQPALLRELVPCEPSAEQWERAGREPRQVLAELYAQAGQKHYPQALLRRLAEVDPSPLWASPELRPLEEFLLEQLYAPPPPRPYPPPAKLPPEPRSEPEHPASTS